MATCALKRSSESGDDSSSYSTRRSVPRRHRSLSRFSHRMPDLDAQVTPMRKGKFVNTVRGSGFPEISLDDLAVEFFDSFSGESEAADSQRRGRPVSRVTNGGMRRLDADTESSRRRRSLSRQPSSAKVDPGSNNSTRRRSVSRQPREKNGEIGNSRRRRSLSVVSRQVDNSESDVDQFLKSFVSGKSQNSGSNRPATSDHRQSLKRSCSQNPIKYHDGYSSHSSAVTDDEGKDSSSTKHGSERIIRTVYAQNKATPKKRESLGNAGYAYQQKLHDDHHGISTFTKGYATKLQESEERKRDLLAEIMLEEERGRELSKNLNEFITANRSEANEKTSRMRKRSKDRSCRMSMCLTDEAEQFIDEFISNIEDTDFSSLEDERSESSSSFGFIKTQSTIIQKSVVPVEMDGVMLPWLQWETPDDSSAALACLNNSPFTPDTKHHVWESDPAQESSSGQGTTIGTISSRGSWSPYESATKPVNPIRRLQIDVGEYLKRPNSSEILNDTWKLRHRISSGSLVLCSRSLF